MSGPLPSHVLPQSERDKSVLDALVFAVAKTGLHFQTAVKLLSQAVMCTLRAGWQEEAMVALKELLDPETFAVLKDSQTSISKAGPPRRSDLAGARVRPLRSVGAGERHEQ